MFSLELMALTRWRLWEPDLAVWCIQERARGLPTVQEHRGTALSFSCLFTSNGETMGSPPEGWPVFVACVFVLHQVFTQNTSAHLRTRSAHPSNLLCRQRHSVPPKNNASPRVTLWPRRGSCCQPRLAEAQHRCPAKDFVFSLKLQPGRSRVSRLSGLRLPCQRSVSQSVSQRRLTAGFSVVTAPPREDVTRPRLHFTTSAARCSFNVTASSPSRVSCSSSRSAVSFSIQ